MNRMISDKERVFGEVLQALRAERPTIFPKPSEQDMRSLAECAQPVIAIVWHADGTANLFIYQNIWEALRTWATVATKHDMHDGDVVRLWYWVAPDELHWDAPVSRANRTWIELR